MKRDNPFTLTFGKEPTEYIVRYEDMDTIISTFEADHPVSQTYLIEGIRGSGKTVLMTVIAKELLSYGTWIIVNLSPTRDLLGDFALRLYDSCHKKTDFLQSGFNVSIGGTGFGINAPQPAKDSVSIIQDLLSELKKNGKKVLITVDEVLPNQNMKDFTSQFQILLREEYPVFLLMTGLYENIDAIQNDPALTFLLRSPKIRLEPLSLHQIRKQYQRIFQIDEEQAKRLAGITKGYAFAFQALGMLVFEHSDQLSEEEILSRLDDMLDSFVYRKVWESLSDLDRRVMLAIPEYPVKAADVCQSLSLTSSTFSTYRSRLLNRGLICSPRYGYVSLCLPRFSVVAKSYA